MDITAPSLRAVAGSREALCAATLPKASVYGKRQIPAGAGITNFKTKHASLSFMDITAPSLRAVAGSREALCAATLPKASVYGKRQIPAGAGITNFKTKHASVVKWI